jgi:hypothetical protein
VPAGVAFLQQTPLLHVCVYLGRWLTNGQIGAILFIT